MKQIAKTLLRRMVRKLPWGAQESLLDGLCDKEGGEYRMLMKLAPKGHVVGFGVTGQYGTLYGSAMDDAILRKYSETGIWAERTVSLVSRYFANSGGTYVDVGANVGATVIPIARNSNVSCLALEPEPANFRALQFNVAVNCSHGNVTTRQVAAFSHHATLDFEMSPDNKGDNRLKTTTAPGALGEERWQTTSVVAMPLDEVVGDVNGPLAIKIDTQGAEPFVVQGGAKTLARADLVIMEYSPYMMARMKANPNVVLEFFRSNFERLSVASGETDAVEPSRPTEDVCADLARLPIQPNVYVDIVATRNITTEVGA